MVLTSADEKLEERGEDENEGLEDDSKETLCFSFAADFFFLVLLLSVSLSLSMLVSPTLPLLSPGGKDFSAPPETVTGVAGQCCRGRRKEEMDKKKPTLTTNYSFL